jgi:hypothetical protein
MENLFLFAIFSSAVFVLLKIIEMKYLEEEMKPLKFVVRDAVMVFTSALAAGFATFYMRGSVTDFLNVVTENKVLNSDSTQVFTDAPGF